MSPEVFLMDLRNRGFELHADGGKLHCRGTLEPLTSEMLVELKEHKPEFIHLLESEKPVPYFNSQGDLMIPFDCDPKYQWWVGGQSVRETKEEIRRNLVN